jgi:hypothetical protein
MPQGGAAKKIQPPASDNNRSSSNAAKRASYEPKKPANDQQAERRDYLESHRGQILPDDSKESALDMHLSLAKKMPKLLYKAVKQSIKEKASGNKENKKPTGAGSASPVGKKSPKNASRSVGPGAITRPVNPMQLASRLQANQQQSRMDNAPGTGPTREEMLASSGTGGNQILGGQFDPLQGQGSFGQEAKAPGSMSESTPSDADERGGGPMMSDLERQRAMQLNQAQMVATADTTGKATNSTNRLQPHYAHRMTQEEIEVLHQQRRKEREKEYNEGLEKDGFYRDEHGGLHRSNTPSNKQSSDIQTAQNLAAAMHMDKTAKALAAAEAIKGNIDAIRKVQKTAQAFWNIIKAGELAAGVSVISLIVLIITANIQMINKYTFKNRIIPPTFFIEDAAIICVNCALCGASCISVTAMPFIMIPLIGSLILLAAFFGLDFLDILDLGIF